MRVQVLQRMASLKRGKALALLATVVSLSGCSTDDGGPVPVACREGPETVEAALTRAPAPVELDGTRLSDCFTRAVDASDLQQLGASYVIVAARLAERAQLRPESADALRLGYLVGAARRGAAGTQGVHDELIRRIEQELGGVDTRSAAYRRGLRAGREHG